MAVAVMAGIAIYLGVIRFLFVAHVGAWQADWIGQAVAFFAGGVLVALGLWSGWHAARVTLQWPKAVAVVARYWIKRSEDRPTGQRFFHPVLRFQTNSGQDVVAISRWGSWRRPWIAGQQLTIHYNPAEPKQIEIPVFAALWALPLTAFGLAACINVAPFIWTWIGGP